MRWEHEGAEFLMKQRAAHTGARVFAGLQGRAVYDALNNGDILSADEVLQAGGNFVGDTPLEPSAGIFVSKQPVDGADIHAMFRITADDLRPGSNHEGGIPHANFQLMRRSVAPGTGRVRFASVGNKHIHISDP